MIKTILAASILATSLSACVDNSNRPIKHPDDRHDTRYHDYDDHDKHGYMNHDHDRHLQQYNGYPYDRGYPRSGVSTGVGVGVGAGSRSGVSTGIGFGFGL